MLHVIINDNLSDPYGEGLFEPNARRTISAHSSKKKFLDRLIVDH